MSRYIVIVNCCFRHGPKPYTTIPGVTPSKFPNGIEYFLIDSFYGIANNYDGNSKDILDEKEIMDKNHKVNFIPETYFVWKKKEKFMMKEESKWKDMKLDYDGKILFIIRNNREISDYDTMDMFNEHIFRNRKYLSYTSESRIDLEEIVDAWEKDKLENIPNIYKAEIWKDGSELNRKAYYERVLIGIEFIIDSLKCSMSELVIPKWDKLNPTYSWIFNTDTPYISGIIKSSRLDVVNVDDHPASFLILESKDFRHKLFNDVLGLTTQLLVKNGKMESNKSKYKDIKFWSIIRDDLIQEELIRKE